MVKQITVPRRRVAVYVMPLWSKALSNHENTGVGVCLSLVYVAPPSKNQVSLASDVSEISTYFQNFRKLAGTIYACVFTISRNIFFL